MRLQWELVDLDQQVLSRLDNRRGGGRIELGLNAGRRAFCPLALDDPALEVAKAIETVLRVVLKGPDDFSLPLFIGRVVIPERGSEAEKRELGLHALDPFFSIERKLIREVNGSVWEAVTFSSDDQSQILWELIDAHEGHGIAEGDLPASVNRDRTYPPGKEVGPALVEMSEVIDGPDFELEPVIAGDGTLCHFNTHYPRQGSDVSADVVFVHGRTPYTAKAFRYSPGGEEIVNRVLAIGAPRDKEGESPFAEHPGYVAEHAGSIALYQEAYEKRLQLDDVTESATLESHAKGAVAAGAFPVPFFDFVAAPEQVTNVRSGKSRTNHCIEPLMGAAGAKWTTYSGATKEVAKADLPSALGGGEGNVLKITTPEAASFAGTKLLADMTLPGAGSDVAAGFWVRAPAGTPMRRAIQEFSPEKELPQDFVNWVASGGWEWVSLNPSVEPATTKCNLLIRLNNGTAVTFEVVLVVIEFGRASPITEDEAFPTASQLEQGRIAWDGPEHASVSHLNTWLEEHSSGEGVPPIFGIDYWLGDTIGVEHYADPDGEPLELTGRVTDAVVTERDSGQIEVKVNCSPEVSAEGVTGSAVTVRVPEAES